MNIIEIIDRIKKYKHIDGDNSVAELLHLSRTALSERKRKSSIPYHELIEFCQSEKISVDWLLTGQGSVCGGAPSASTESKSSESAPINTDLLKEIVTSLEYVLENQNIYLRPGKKADLITYLYETSLSDEAIKELIINKIELLVNLASDEKGKKSKEKAAS